jgi:potassium channel subfamily K protein
MFAEWEGWNYLDSVYFCVTSLGKIGFGDLVPGTQDGDSTMHEVKLVVNFVYLLLGMAIVAMCYYLLKEEVGVKLAYIKDKIRNKVQFFKQLIRPN